MRVHGGDDCCDCGEGGRGSGDCVVAALERQPPQKRPKACYRVVDHTYCQEHEHENQMIRVLALQPEGAKLVYVRPANEWWASGHHYADRQERQE